MLILFPLALIPCMSLGGKIMIIDKQFVMPQYNSAHHQKRAICQHICANTHVFRFEQDINNSPAFGLCKLC